MSIVLHLRTSARGHRNAVVVPESKFLAVAFAIRKQRLEAIWLSKAALLASECDGQVDLKLSDKLGASEGAANNGSIKVVYLRQFEF